MRPSIPFLFAASLLASSVATAVPAQSPTNVPPTLEQMEELEGAYRLSDGIRVQVVVIDERMFADIGARDRVELFAAGPNRVASRDGRVTLEGASPGKDAALTLRRERAQDVSSL